MQKRDIIMNAVTREIERLGGVIEDIRRAKGSHRMVYWSLDGVKRTSLVPHYTGNWRSIHHARGNIRRLIREAKIDEPTSV
jgi:hypothetical protein